VPVLSDEPHRRAAGDEGTEAGVGIVLDDWTRVAAGREEEDTAGVGLDAKCTEAAAVLA